MAAGTIPIDRTGAGYDEVSNVINSARLQRYFGVEVQASVHDNSQHGTIKHLQNNNQRSDSIRGPSKRPTTSRFIARSKPKLRKKGSKKDRSVIRIRRPEPYPNSLTRCVDTDHHPTADAVSSDHPTVSRLKSWFDRFQSSSTNQDHAHEVPSDSPPCDFHGDTVLHRTLWQPSIAEIYED